MELAKITSKGQITLPIDIRRKLGLKEGDKVLFLEEDGKIFVQNAALIALREAQSAFSGEAEKAGLHDEQDVVAVIKELRREP